ncbi:MAG: hypothetical protein ACPGZP_03385, partial [Panacagrimonas sp.]
MAELSEEERRRLKELREQAERALTEDPAVEEVAELSDAEPVSEAQAPGAFTEGAEIDVASSGAIASDAAGAAAASSGV